MVQALEEIIAKSSSIVFFGGAGVSTESGIPDFRSVDGLYHQKLRLPAGNHPESHFLGGRTRRSFTVFTAISSS